jgi:hypothetical protein
MDQFHESIRIKVDIGQRGKNGFTGKMVNGYIPDADISTFCRHLGQSFYRINQKILKGGDIRLLSADTDFCTPLAFCRLFTLKTKHGWPPLFYLNGFKKVCMVTM